MQCCLQASQQRQVREEAELLEPVFGEGKDATAHDDDLELGAELLGAEGGDAGPSMIMHDEPVSIPMG